MSSLRDLRRRVGTVRSIRQITGAMKMVAVARMRRTREALVATRPYARRLEAILSHLLERADRDRTPLLGPSAGRGILLVVVTSDKGLCGAFNTNVLREARRFLAGHEERPVGIIAVGKKGRDHFVRRGLAPHLALVDLFRSLAFEFVLEPRDRIIDAFVRGEIGEAHIIHNEFKSALIQKVVTRRLLPLRETIARPTNTIDFEYVPDAKTVLTELLPRYLAVELWMALLESHAAEMAARVRAMGAATTNADGMISRLTLVANRLRQAGITREIAEITAGAEALA